MLWVAWRQHRAQAIGAAAVAAVIAVYAVTVGFMIRDAAVDSGLVDCLADGRACDLLTVELLRRFDRTVGLLNFSIWLPLLVGAVLAAGIGLLHDGYYGRAGMPMSLSTSRFDLHDLTPAALALATFGIGVMAGVLLRRPLPAMAVSLGLGFGLVQLVSWLREDLIEPIRLEAPYGEAAARPTDQVVAEGFLDRSGNEITGEEIDRLCGASAGLDGFETCLRDAGIQTFALVHPDGRYWILQGLNTAMFLAAGILALAVAYWATVHRTR
jgi:hypothetical protein